MKRIIFLATLFIAMHSFAQDKDTAKKDDKKQSHLQMHEEMVKAHQQAVDCLKSGKSEDECRKAFHEMCKNSGGREMCGPGMMRYKMDKKSKRP